MAVRAVRFVRKMRGGAQAHLLEADDGHFYVVKFRNNPQHRRILINELVCAVLLRHLRVSSPEAEIVEIDGKFLQDYPEVFIQLGGRRTPVETGRHFGSRYPGEPLRLAVYDFLPDLLLDKVANLREFLATLVFDKWVANADARQCIFYRARVRDETSSVERTAFVASMMDHGFAFDGPNWRFGDSPIAGLYHRKAVYEKASSLEDFQPWLDQVRNFPEEVIDKAWKIIPGEWFDGDETEFEQLLEKLLARRKRVADLIEQCAKGRIKPFPGWK